jgi:hypothetical protein
MAVAASEKSNGKSIRWNGIINRNHLPRHRASQFPQAANRKHQGSAGAEANASAKMLALEREIMRLLKCEYDNYRLDQRFGPRCIKRS